MFLLKSYVYIFTEKLKNQAESYIFLSGNKNCLFIPFNSDLVKLENEA